MNVPMPPIELIQQVGATYINQQADAEVVRRLLDTPKCGPLLVRIDDAPTSGVSRASLAAYEVMGYALDSLKYTDTVSEP